MCKLLAQCFFMQVSWMKTEFDVSSSKHRAVFLFAVGNLTRWMTLVAQTTSRCGCQVAASEALATK